MVMLFTQRPGNPFWSTSIHVGDAVVALGDADLVLCPDRDGGYNLVGLRAPEASIFEHPMSTARALEDTAARARYVASVYAAQATAVRPRSSAG